MTTPASSGSGVHVYHERIALFVIPVTTCRSCFPTYQNIWPHCHNFKNCPCFHLPWITEHLPRHRSPPGWDEDTRQGAVNLHNTLRIASSFDVKHADLHEREPGTWALLHRTRFTAGANTSLTTTTISCFVKMGKLSRSAAPSTIADLLMPFGTQASLVCRPP